VSLTTTTPPTVTEEKKGEREECGLPVCRMSSRGGAGNPEEPQRGSREKKREEVDLVDHPVYVERREGRGGRQHALPPSTGGGKKKKAFTPAVPPTGLGRRGRKERTVEPVRIYPASAFPGGGEKKGEGGEAFELF